MDENNFTDDEVLSLLIFLISGRLNELLGAASANSGFIKGEIAAYTDCLKMVATWESAQKHGLDPHYFAKENEDDLL